MVLASLGCRGTSGGMARPSALTYSDAVQATCSPGNHATPFIVDLPPDRRSDVELALRHGTTVVSYDCKELTVLSDCTVGGEYLYEGLTIREQVISINDEEELRANLPLGGLGIASQLGADFTRGRTLDVALAIVGKRTSAKRRVIRSELEGSCGAATHIVRSSHVGAFALDTGERGELKVAATLFGTGAGSRSAHSKRAVNRDGSLEACRHPSPSTSNEKPDCAAPLRLELVPLLEAPLDGRMAQAAAAAQEDPAPSCPTGLRPNDNGKCVKVGPQVSYVCDKEDPKTCAEECEKGSMASCAILGRGYQVGRGVPTDLEKAIKLLAKACKGGATPGCGRLGEMMVRSDATEKDGIQMLRKSCEAGWFQGCTIAAAHLREKQPQGNNVADLFRRGCAGGDAEGCWNLGELFRLGLGVPQNDSESHRFFGLACDGGARLGCSSLAKMMTEGRGNPPDATGAMAVLARACDRGYSSSCSELAMFYLKGDGVARDTGKGIALLERACEGTDRGQCLTLGMRYQLGQGVEQNNEKATRYFRMACEAGVTVACREAQVPSGGR